MIQLDGAERDQLGLDAHVISTAGATLTCTNCGWLADNYLLTAPSAEIRMAPGLAIFYHLPSD